MSIKLTPAMRAALDTIAKDVHAPGVKGVTLDALAKRGMIRCRQRHDANGYAEEFARWYLTTTGATEQARQAGQAARGAAASVGPRGAVHVIEAKRLGDGTSRSWTRVLSGKRYSFTAVLMPDGERRYSISRFDGPEGASNFAHYWTQVHFVTVPPPADHCAEVNPTPGPFGSALRCVSLGKGHEGQCVDSLGRGWWPPVANTGLAEALDRVETGSIARRELARVANHDYGTCGSATAEGGVCGRPLDAYGRCDGVAGHWGGRTSVERVTAALDVLVKDAQARLTEAEQRPAAERDAGVMAALHARCAALVDAYHLCPSEAPQVAASFMIKDRSAEGRGGEV